MDKKRELKEADNWQIRRTGTNKAGGQAQANETIIPKHGENVSDNVAGNVGVQLEAEVEDKDEFEHDNEIEDEVEFEHDNEDEDEQFQARAALLCLR